MRDVRVVQTEDGKFKVLINFIQRGIEYSTKALAEREMNIIIKEYLA